MTSTVQPRERWAWLTAASLCLAYVLYVEARPLPGRLFGALDVVAYAAAAAVAGLACRARSQREVGRLRSGWRWLAAAAGAFALGQLLYATEYAWRGKAPTPGQSPSNVVTFLLLPCTVVGLAYLAGGETVTGRLVNVLDALFVTVSWLFVAWAWLVGPAYRAREPASASPVAMMAFLVTSLVVVAAAVVVATRWTGDRSVLVVAAAAVWLGVTHTAYAAVVFRGGSRIGNPFLDVGWFGPFLLVAVAASYGRRRTRLVDVRRHWLLPLAIPSVALLAALVTAVVMLHRHEDDLLLQVTASLLVVLVLTRQALTLWESGTLTHDLERRVAARTAQARAYEAQVRALLQQSSDLIAMVGPDLRFGYVSAASSSLLGLQPDELLGRHLLDFVHPDDRAATQAALEAIGQEVPGTVTFRLLCQHQDWCEVEASTSVVHDEQVGAGMVLNIRDVSERVAAQEELRRQALVDPLTSLANRRAFDDRVGHALDRAARTGEPVSVLFVDLDHFKQVNDSAGHAAGDEVLVEVSRRLRTCLRPADTAARLGGDEFGVLLEDTSSVQAQEVAERVGAAMAAPYRTSAGELTVTASVGVTSTEGDAGRTPDLVRDADVAMYRAKASGRARVEVFEPGMGAELQEQHDIEAGLRHALAGDRLRVVYQPLVDLSTRAVTGVEALLRWRPVGGEEVAPARFLPVAEQRGLVHGLDVWVLLHACRQVRQWQSRQPEGPRLQVHVNLAAADLRDPGLAREVGEVLSETGLDASDLVLEVAESSVQPDDEVTIASLTSLRTLGVRVWLDDFGAGYASLATLRDVPLDGVKLAPSFVAGLETGRQDRAVVAAVLELVRALGLTAVAEAVETPRQAAVLQDLGCTVAQGFLFAPPLADEAAAELVLSGTAGPAVADER